MIARSNTVVSAIKRSCWAVIVLVSVGCPFALVADDAYPRRPIKLIVPFAAGGGTDTFARTVVQAIDEADLLSQPIVIINVPGASGTIGSRRVKGADTSMTTGQTMIFVKWSSMRCYGLPRSRFPPMVSSHRYPKSCSTQT